MDNYLLFGHKLVCKVVPKDQIHPNTFKGANRKFKRIPFRKLAKEIHNSPKEPEQVQKTIKRLLKKEKMKRQKIKELGIEYEFPGYSSKVNPAPTYKNFKDI